MHIFVKKQKAKTKSRNLIFNSLLKSTFTNIHLKADFTNGLRKPYLKTLKKRLKYLEIRCIQHIFLLNSASF